MPARFFFALTATGSPGCHSERPQARPAAASGPRLARLPPAAQARPAATSGHRLARLPPAAPGSPGCHQRATGSPGCHQRPQARPAATSAHRLARLPPAPTGSPGCHQRPQARPAASLGLPPQTGCRDRARNSDRRAKYRRKSSRNSSASIRFPADE